MQRSYIGVGLVGLVAIGLWWAMAQVKPEASDASQEASASMSSTTEPSSSPPSIRGRTASDSSPQASPSPSPIPPSRRSPVTYTPDPEDDRALVGLDVSGVTDAERSRLRVPDQFGRGVIIRSIHPDAPAVLAGLAIDDVIVRARRTSIDSVQDLQTAVGTRLHTVLTIAREGRLFHVVLHKPYIPPPNQVSPGSGGG